MTKPSSLDLALRSPPVVPARLSADFFSALGERIETALAAPRRETLAEMGEALQRLLDVKLEQAPEDMRLALTGHQETAGTIEAAEIGRLTFALQLLTQALQKRAPDEVLALVRSEPYAPYLGELFRGERTNAELREQFGEASETVSRKLRTLRESGVTDFRKEGRRIVNFLTPSGWACMPAAEEAAAEDAAALKLGVPAATDPVVTARELAILTLKKRLAPQFTEQPIIQGSDPEQRLCGHG